MSVSRETYRNKIKLAVVILLILLFSIGAVVLSSKYGKYTNLSGVKDLLEEDISEELRKVDLLISKDSVDFDNLLMISKDYLQRDFVFFNRVSKDLRLTSNDIILTDSVWDEVLNKSGIFYLNTKTKHYLCHKIIDNDKQLLLHLIGLKYNFSEENTYLNNTFLLNRQIPKEVLITVFNDDNPSQEGEIVFLDDLPLFRIMAADKNLNLSLRYSQILFAYYFVFFALLIYVLWLVYGKFVYFRNNPILRLVFYSVDVILFLWLSYYFEFPISLYESTLFKNHQIPLLGSQIGLGSYIFFTFILLNLSVLWYNKFPVKNINRIGSHVFAFIIFVFIGLIIRFFFYFTEKVVYNTNIFVNLYYPFRVNEYGLSVITVISFLFLSVLLLSFFIVKLSENLDLKERMFFLVFSFLISGIISFLIKDFVFLLFVQFSALLIHFSSYLREKRNRYISLTLFILASLYIPYKINKCYEKKEEEIIKVQSVGLLNNRDRILEINFVEEIARLEDELKRNDTTVINQLNKSEEELNTFIINNYFYQFKDKYYINIIYCDKDTELLINSEKQPDNCFSYFEGIIKEIGLPTLSTSLYFMDDGDQRKSYIAMIKLPDNRILYADIYEKVSVQSKGYPELLLGGKESILITPFHSYAFYRDNHLVASYGAYNFPIVFDSTLFLNNDYKHHYFAQNKIKIVITTQKVKFSDYIASVFYWLIILLFFFLIIQLMHYQETSKRRVMKTFRGRLQTYMLSILFVVFSSIAIFSLFHIKSKTLQKNKDDLKELSNSLLVALYKNYAGLSFMDNKHISDLYSELISLSNIFVTDINIYGAEGFLALSSRQEVFDNKIINRYMNPFVFKELREKKLDYLIVNENIGDYAFLSAYFPLINYDNKVIGYLNIPYLSKEKQMNQELTSYLSGFINIYIILAILSIMLLWIIANYVTKPMRSIKNAIREIKVSEKNVKIRIKRNDEIGELVNAYNNMIDKLEKSIRQLADNEREMAWKEMAKQVAHEIKNPLTPMKLNIQHFQRVYRTDDKEKNEQLTKFSNTLIQQIDSLSAIASAFSDFGKMPKSNITPTNIRDIADEVAGLYKGFSNISITVKGKEDNIALVDAKQMKRIFINLIKNAIQAIDKSIKGYITIDFSHEKDKIRILVSDNGSGIPEDKKDKIFLPNFTTKSTGSGLGLPIVKKIIENFQGSISVLSTSKEGTTFEIFLTLYKES